MHAQPTAPIETRLSVPTEAYLNHIIRMDKFPRVAEAQPMIGSLYLVAVLKSLLKDAKLIADAITYSRQIEGGKRVDEARSEPP